MYGSIVELELLKRAPVENANELGEPHGSLHFTTPHTMSTPNTTETKSEHKSCRNKDESQLVIHSP